jgi:hypothetical protein
MLASNLLPTRRRLPRAGRLLRDAIGLVALIGATPLLLGAQDSVSEAPAAGTSTLKGVYTEAQAKRGESAYYTYCVNCHSTREYTGSDFKVAWVSRSAYDIFSRISTEMPDDDPGILARQEYIDIVAYMFQLNGYPTGAAELPTDDDGLRSVRIEPVADSASKPPPDTGAKVPPDTGAKVPPDTGAKVPPDTGTVVRPHADWSALQIRRHPLPIPGRGRQRR